MLGWVYLISSRYLDRPKYEAAVQTQRLLEVDCIETNAQVEIFVDTNRYAEAMTTRFLGVKLEPYMASKRFQINRSYLRRTSLRA